MQRRGLGAPQDKFQVVLPGRGLGPPLFERGGEAKENHHGVVSVLKGKAEGKPPFRGLRGKAKAKPDLFVNGNLPSEMQRHKAEPDKFTCAKSKGA